MLKPKLMELNLRSLINIMGIIEGFGWNVFIHGNSECYITNESPKDFSEIKDTNYMYFEIRSENVIRVGMKLKHKELSFFDDFCKKNILVSKEDIRIFANEQVIVFKNMTDASIEKEYHYKRRSI